MKYAKKPVDVLDAETQEVMIANKQIKDVVRFLGLTENDRGNIYACLNNKRSKVKHYSFRYAAE